MTLSELLENPMKGKMVSDDVEINFSSEDDYKEFMKAFGKKVPKSSSTSWASNPDKFIVYIDTEELANLAQKVLKGLSIKAKVKTFKPKS